MQRPPGPPVMRILLVEDSPRLREVIASMLGEIAGVVIVGEADDEDSAIGQLAQGQVDLAIVDLRLKAGSGLGVLGALAREPERFGRPRTVVFSNHDHPRLRERCRQLGAEGFFNKASQLDELIDFLLAARSAVCDH